MPRFLLAVVLSVSFSAWAKLPVEDVEKLEQKKALLSAELGILNSDKGCFADGECDILEAGAKSCGGPSTYIIYNSSGRNVASIKAKAQELTDVEKKLNNMSPAFVTDCSYTSAPEPRCTKSVCTGK